jgi:adenosylcobyric acid synthase
MTLIADRTGWAPLGILPWFADAWRLPAEDIMDLKSRPGGALKIAVPRLHRIANFDDLDPLSAHPGVSVEIIEPGRPLPGDAALVILPGSKATIADLAHFRAQGWDIDLAAHVRRGGHVLGICGGYQMLGRTIADPDGIEGPPDKVAGLGLLDVDTVMSPRKQLALTRAQEEFSGAVMSGYEIHLGETTGTATPWITVAGRSVGTLSGDGRIKGSYLHGLFADDAYRGAYLASLGAADHDTSYGATVETTLDSLAAHIEAHLDVDRIFGLAAEIS